MPDRSTTKIEKMIENSEFRQIGKEVPYKTPAGFFESITENTLQKAILREQMHRKNNIRRVVFSVAASTALLLFLGYQWMIYPEAQSPEQTLSESTKAEGLSDVLTEITDDELQQMAAMYQTDPFSEDPIE